MSGSIGAFRHAQEPPRLVTDTYRGFRYQVTRTPRGNAELYVEGFRLPPRRYWPSIEEARRGLEHWADLEIALGRRGGE